MRTESAPEKMAVRGLPGVPLLDQSQVSGLCMTQRPKKRLGRGRLALQSLGDQNERSKSGNDADPLLAPESFLQYEPGQ